MKIIGITGGIGSGKSVVCAIFRTLGVPVYDADQEAKKLYDKYPELLEKIKTEVSDEVFDRNGKLDKKKMAEIVFSDTEKLKLLNSFVHPVVRKDFLKWSSLQSDQAYVLKEAAILFESGAYKDCDQIITVVSPVDLRIQRVRERDRKSRTDVEKIIENQWNDQERVKKSDFIITNDEQEMLIPQVLAIHDQLMKEYKRIQENKKD
ncbi:MAG: dephospho-CoA kinase [Bacteroidetes bacterium]|nr:MAG: dephospho-CoA kinase [Bacteroidota bacterium]